MNKRFTTTIKTIIILLSVFVSSQVIAQTACVKIAGKNLEPLEIYDQRHQCGTCPGQESQRKLCDSLNHLMVPYWSAQADIFPIPHRGLWGQPIGSNVSENTLAAFKAALAGGYSVVEVDAALTGADSSGQRKVFLGHYFSMAAAGGPKNKAPKDYTPNQLVQFFMNQRDGSPGWGDDNRLALLTDLIAWAKSNQVVLMIDPKIPGGAPADEYEQIIAYALDDAKSKDALGNIVIKTEHSYEITRLGVSRYLTEPFSSYEGKFLWSPIINKDMEISQSTVIDSIMYWHNSTNASKQIANYEISMFNPDYWGAKEFTAGGKQWKNLIDYLRGLTALGKRSAFWSVDAMSDRGTLGRDYNWKFIGNTDDDLRGNPVTNIQYYLATHVAINTDRPDIYKNLVINPYE